MLSFLLRDPTQRLQRLEQQLAGIVPSWSMAPVVPAYQAMRSASFLVAVSLAAEIGDVRRFDAPRQLMSFLGLLPAESSTGDRVRRKGPAPGRQSACSPGVGRGRLDLPPSGQGQRNTANPHRSLPKPVRDIAWKAKHRLCTRYRRLGAASKKLPVVVAAIAREMAASLWAIGREIAPV